MRKAIAIALALLMLLCCACGSGEDTESTIDLGGDEGWDIETDDSTDVDNTGDSSDAANTSDATQTTSSSNKKPSGVQGVTVKDADTLSWSELLAQMPSSLRGTTITIYSWNDAKDVTGSEKVMSDFTKQTGIKVKWLKGSYENYDAEIAAKINSGNAPDVIRYINPYISRMSLTQDVKTATGYDFKGDIWDNVLTSAYTVKGKIYGVNLKNTFNQQPTIVAYSKNTINRYKLDDPYELWKNGEWNMDNFIDICKAFTEETQRPAWMTCAQVDVLWFSGATMISFDGKEYKNNLSDKKVLDALRKCTYYRSDNIVPAATREGDKLENGTYLFYTDNMIGHRRTDFHFSTLKSNDDLYCVPFPTGLTDKYYQAYNEYEAYGIPKGAKNPDAVYYFLRYYLDANNYDRNMFFCNNQALEVFEWCRSQKNVHVTIDRGLTATAGNQNAGLEVYLRINGTEAQLQAEIDKVSVPVVNQAVKQANETLAKFK